MRKLCFGENWRCNGKPVTLPHDAMIAEKRSKDASDGGHGYFPGGVYTYEKTFTAPAEWAGKKVLIEFEGIYRNCTVSLNGKEIGGHKYGYTTFALPLENLNIGGGNTLTVVADNSQIPNSRWYTGSGIYRPVWLYVGDEERIEYRGVKITTVSINPAVVRVEVNATAEARVEILDGETVVASGAPGEFTIPGAKLWSDETPDLYTCRVTVGEDAVEETFGIREIKWSNKGLFINGKKTLLRGGCIHHDNGILGAATYDESEWRRVRIMKEAGFNAIRSAHNPASRALLEACDHYGMYVMDETFDMWYLRKTKYDFAMDFDGCWEENTAEMVERDYNRPCVIMYSICNEVSEPGEARGVELAKRMVALIHGLDPSRPVTGGVNLMIVGNYAKGKGMYADVDKNADSIQKANKLSDSDPKNASLIFNIMASLVGSNMNKAANSRRVDAVTAPVLDALDICGYNYASGRYGMDGKLHPDRVILGSETFSFDVCKNWNMMREHPYLVGDFMWTAWDYLGEAGIGAWSYTGGMPFNRPYPWVLGGAGVIDITGKPDGSCRYASTVWGLEKKPRIAVKPVNHPGVRVSKSVWRGTNAMESWAWSGCEGNKAEVEVYSDAAAVELLLGGKSLGKKKIKECKAIFKTRYAPEVLTAVAYGADGEETARSSLSPATGTPHIRLIPEKSSSDIVYIPVEIAGENGVVESNADRKLTVTVEGGELLAFGSANPCTEEQYHTGSFTTYYGRALAVVRVTGSATITVTDGKERVSTEL